MNCLELLLKQFGIKTKRRRREPYFKGELICDDDACPERGERNRCYTTDYLQCQKYFSDS
jgi:hypothetical protein